MVSVMDDLMMMMIVVIGDDVLRFRFDDRTALWRLITSILVVPLGMIIIVVVIDIEFDRLQEFTERRLAEQQYGGRLFGGNHRCL